MHMENEGSARSLQAKAFLCNIKAVGKEETFSLRIQSDDKLTHCASLINIWALAITTTLLLALLLSRDCISNCHFVTSP